MTNLNNDQKYRYSLEHIDFTKMQTVRDALIHLKEHDYDSFEDSFRVGVINYAIVKEVGENEQTKLMVAFKSGFTHDIGKLGMPLVLLKHPGSYDTFMFNEMKKHVTGGAFILEQVKADTELIKVALYHHCNVDRTGYEGGLEKDDIPELARVTRISDSADAYMTKRCYKAGGPAFGVYEDLKQFKDRSYDPELLEAFGKVHEKVMERCHALGEDNPSQDFYMNEMMDLYLQDFPAKTSEEALDLF